MGQEQVANKFVAAWNVFAQTCAHFWAPEPSSQAWFAHYLISQFGIDRVAREPIIHVGNFSESALKTKVGGGEVRPDVVVIREPGIMMPHYANRLGKASDLAGLGVQKTLAVVREFKIGDSAQRGLNMSELIRDADKLPHFRPKNCLNPGVTVSGKWRLIRSFVGGSVVPKEELSE